MKFALIAQRIRLLDDASGAVTDTWRYTAFGEELTHTGTGANPYRFAGERFVGEVGLYQNRARWLDTGRGAFVSVDPLLESTRSPYSYADQEPANLSDASGRFSVASVGISIGIGASLGAIGGMSVNYATNGVFWDLKAAGAGALVGGAFGAAALTSYAGLAAAFGLSLGIEGLPGLVQIASDKNKSFSQRLTAGILAVSVVAGPAVALRYSQTARGNNQAVASAAGEIEVGAQGATGPLESLNLLDAARRSLGMSAEEIAEAARNAGYSAEVLPSARAGSRSTRIRIEGHSTITQVLVHPGGGRHVGAYVKISTSTLGRIKIVDPSKYVGAADENAFIIEVEP